MCKRALVGLNLFAVVMGVAFWLLPFSAFAASFDGCVPVGMNPACPTGTTLSSTSGACLAGENLCVFTVNPCTISGISCSSAPCSGSTPYLVRNCSTVCSTGNWCVPKSVAPAGSSSTSTSTSSSSSSGGSASCSGTQRSACLTGETIASVDPVTSLKCCTSSASATNAQTVVVKNPLAFDTVEGVLGSLLGTLQGIIVVLSLAFIVIGAVLYITSAGDDKRMTMAKGAITASMIGLAIGLAAPSFLKEIGSILGWGPVSGSAVSGAKTLSEIAMNILNFLLSIVGVLGIIMLVVGGIVYITAAGDEDRIETGKKTVKYALVGIAVALAALIVVSQIAALFA